LVIEFLGYFPTPGDGQIEGFGGVLEVRSVQDGLENENLVLRENLLQGLSFLLNFLKLFYNFPMVFHVRVKNNLLHKVAHLLLLFF